MSDDRVQRRTLAWALLADEAVQNEVTDMQSRAFGAEASATYPPVPAADPVKLGTLESPIAVNGIYGQTSYLSLLRTGKGLPFAFHRLSSHSGPNNSRVDLFELVSVDGTTRTEVYLDRYYRSRTRQAPAGLKLASDFLPECPIFGTGKRVAGFPSGIADAARQWQKLHYDFEFPVTILEQLERRVFGHTSPFEEGMSVSY